MLTSATIGISLTGFCKLIAQDVAIQSARFGALADQSATSADMMASDTLKRIGFGNLFLASVDATKRYIAESCRITVEVKLAAVPIGFVRSLTEIKESSSAVCEIQ